jgi:hypothetical protein
VKTHGKQNALALHPLETGRKLNLGNGEGVTQVKGAVHVRVRESTEPLWVLLLDLLHLGLDLFRRQVSEEVSVGGA